MLLLCVGGWFVCCVLFVVLCLLSVVRFVIVGVFVVRCFLCVECGVWCRCC